MKNYIILAIAISIILVLVLPTLLSAQPILPDAPDQAPIDGGLTLLAAGGGAYALKKLSAKNKE